MIFVDEILFIEFSLRDVPDLIALYHVAYLLYQLMMVIVRILVEASADEELPPNAIKFKSRLMLVSSTNYK